MSAPKDTHHDPGPHDVTRCLQRAQAGDAGAQDALMSLIHAELRRIARQSMGRGHGGTLQPTALVNEAWLKLAQSDADWTSRRHFFSVAAMAMRQVIVNHLRARTAQKRDGRRIELELIDGVSIECDDQGTDLVELNQQILALRKVAPELAEVVDLRFFAGLGNREISELLEVSERTVERRWSLARAWLRQRMCPN